jgi:large subunit ribosomal protein L21
VYAIIKSGGRQLRVSPGSVVNVDHRDAQPGDELSLDEVLLVAQDTGTVVSGAPYVANARVLAVVDGHVKGPKLRIFRKKRRKGMRRTTGHRSILTRLRVKEIVV